MKAACVETVDIDVECTFCKVAMRAYRGSGGQVRYHRCESCRRWVSSSYREVLGADAGFRARPQAPKADKEQVFTQAKDRLERWLAAIDDQDPYRTLGVSPMASDEQVKSKYRELALRKHPDRGGTADEMRAVNDAYERIVQHRERRRAEREIAALPSDQSPRPGQ